MSHGLSVRELRRKIRQKRSIAELLQLNGTVVEKGLEIIRKLCYNDILKCNALTGQSHTDRKEEPIT